MNSQKEYLATVMVPAYNHERFIIECLEGLANQTFKDFQCIITDDCSTDRTPLILKENQRKYRYELILNKKNMGISASLTNMAQNYARGKYIFICASDDVYTPDRIEKQVKFMENHPSYGMCYARTIMIDVNSRIVGKDTFQGYLSGNIFKEVFLRRFNIGICVAMKAEVLAELGYYKQGLLAEDYYMNCKFAEKYPIGFIDDYLLKYRIAPLSNKRDPWRLVDSHRQTIEYFSYRPEYKEAVYQWKLRASLTIAPYIKYKVRAISILFNCIVGTKNFQDVYYLLRTFKALLLRWE